MDAVIDNKLDKYDVGVSIASGALTAAMDVLWVKDISLADAHSWGVQKTDEFVIRVAKSKGYAGNDIAGAIRKLELDYPIDADLLTEKFGSGGYHHLRDFAHHPTPIGLLFSILSQFTGKGYGTDTVGRFKAIDIPNWKPRSAEESLYMGSVTWIMHMISDVAGSYNTRSIGKEGTGLPGPMLSFLKEISSMPLIRNVAGKREKNNSPNKESNYVFSETCSKLFRGTLLAEHDENGKIVKGTELPFDFRTELGIVHESIKTKQYIPVLLNTLIVSAFYSVRRLLRQIQEKSIDSIEQLNEVDIRGCLPWKNDTIRHMRMISSATFSTIDLTSAGIKAAVKNKNNKSGFALDFLQGINYWGLGNLALSSNSEVLSGIGKLHNEFLRIADEQKKKIIEKLPNGEEDWNDGKTVVQLGLTLGTLNTPVGIVMAAISVYDQIKCSARDLKLATEERIRIENECAERILVIRENREEMEAEISEYLDSRITVFAEAFSTMDRAVGENDIEGYILGNNMIQKELSGKVAFNNMSEFDDMMNAEEAIKL